MTEDLDAHVDRLHALGVVDMHFDLLLDLYDRRSQPRLLADEFLPEFRAGGIGVIGVAIYLEDKHLPELGLRVALDQISRLYAEVDGASDFAICRTFDEIVASRAAGQIALVITLEGVEPLGADPDMLRIFYELGVRSVGLTHVRRNAAGDGGIFAAGGSSPAGLTAFGKAVVRECQRLGILTDLAHLNAAGVADILELTEGPVIISHSNPRRFHDIDRNSSDEQIKAVAQRGGVIGVNAVLLSPHKEMATIDHYVDQVAYIADLAGIDHVGIGFDFVEFLYRRWSLEAKGKLEATTTRSHFVPDLSNHSHARNLTRRLIERGFGDEEIGKVLFGNWMRALSILRPR